MANQITIKADDENNAELFWAAFGDAYPAIAKQVRNGEATVDFATWEAIQKLDGFADGPEHAPGALVEVQTLTRTEKMTKPVTTSYANGRTAEYDSYDEAVEAIRAQCGDAEIGHSGDLSDGGDRTLCWANEASSVNDDGANAVAAIRWAE